MPEDFGLAVSSSSVAYELGLDKISRLNSQNDNALSHFDLANSAKLNAIALGIAVSQIMTINVAQSSSYTVDDETSVTFTVSTSIDSKPASADLHCYIVADNYLNNTNAATNESGSCQLMVQFPSVTADDARLIVFARTQFDDRITSHATYSFAASTQETVPTSRLLALSPTDYTLTFNASSGIAVDNVYVLSYSYQQNITSIQESQCLIPKLIDNSPFILVACGHNGGEYLEEWTAYPQVPLTAGSTFSNSERNVFTYMVTVNGVHYKLEVSLGDINN